MRYKNKAFTLSELLIALGIIGVIAVLSIPSIISTIQYNILATQLKNNVVAIQQIIDDQKVEHKTQSLDDTDFKSAESFYALLSKSQTCTKDTKCWGEKYKAISGIDAYEPAIPKDGEGIKLKNGATLSYKYTKTLKQGDKSEIDNGLKKNEFARIYIDVNGPEQPNIIGRDLFRIIIFENGSIRGSGSQNETTCDETTECFNALMRNNWKMPKDDKYWNTNESFYDNAKEKEEERGSGKGIEDEDIPSNREDSDS